MNANEREWRRDRGRTSTAETQRTRRGRGWRDEKPPMDADTRRWGWRDGEIEGLRDLGRFVLQFSCSPGSAGEGFHRRDAENAERDGEIAASRNGEIVGTGGMGPSVLQFSLSTGSARHVRDLRKRRKGDGLLPLCSADLCSPGAVPAGFRRISPLSAAFGGLRSPGG